MNSFQGWLSTQAILLAIVLIELPGIFISMWFCPCLIVLSAENTVKCQNLYFFVKNNHQGKDKLQ